MVAPCKATAHLWLRFHGLPKNGMNHFHPFSHHYVYQQSPSYKSAQDSNLHALSQ